MTLLPKAVEENTGKCEEEVWDALLSPSASCKTPGKDTLLTPPQGGRCTGCRGGLDHSPLQKGASHCVSWWRSTYFSCFVKSNDKERICRRALWCTGASTWWSSAAFNLDFKAWTTVTRQGRAYYKTECQAKAKILFCSPKEKEGSPISSSYSSHTKIAVKYYTTSVRILSLSRKKDSEVDKTTSFKALESQLFPRTIQILIFFSNTITKIVNMRLKIQ